MQIFAIQPTLAIANASRSDATLDVLQRLSTRPLFERILLEVEHRLHGNNDRYDQQTQTMRHLLRVAIFW